MDCLEYNTKQRKGKHLNYEQRIRIETLSKAGFKSEEIGRQIGCSGRTVRRELQRGKVELLNSDLTTKLEYSADVGEKKHREAGTAKGPMLKIGNEYKLVEYIEKLIIDDKMSPYAVAEKIKTEDEWVGMDLNYIENRTTLGDLKIIFKTPFAMLSATGR